MLGSVVVAVSRRTYASRVCPTYVSRKGVPASLAARHTSRSVRERKCMYGGRERVSGAPFPCRDALLRGPFFLSAVVRGQGGRMHPAVAVAVAARPGAVYITPVLSPAHSPCVQRGAAALLAVRLPPMRQKAAETTPHRPAGSPATAPSLVPSLPSRTEGWTGPPSFVRPASGPMTLSSSPLTAPEP